MNRKPKHNPRPTPATLREATFLVLGTDYQWDREPRHALDIPPSWSKAFDGDFTFDEGRDVGLTREQALVRAACLNADHLDETEHPAAWWMVFEVGEISDSSFINLTGGATAQFNL